MKLLERVFNTLEKVDRGVSLAVSTVQKMRGASPAESPGASEPAGAKPGAEQAGGGTGANSGAQSEADAWASRPLGDPAVAVRIFGRKLDPWTERATRILKDLDVGYEFVELDAPGLERLVARLANETKQDITPYVYLRGEFVGGYNALNEIERLGQLEEMIKSPEERAKSARAGIKIEVARRGAEERPPGERS